MWDWLKKLLGMTEKTITDEAKSRIKEQAVHGLEEVQGAENIKVVGTGDDVQVLRTSGEAQFIDDDGDRIWVNPGVDQGVLPAQWQDVWGPLDNTQVNEFAYHMVTIEDAQGMTPEQLPEICQRLGYADVGQWFRVRVTFVKYFGVGEPQGTLDSYVFGDQMTQAMIHARTREQQEKMAQTAAANPEMLAPVEGIDVDTYALCAASAAKGLPQDQFLQLLGQHGMDLAKWERVNAEWTDRMSKDTTATIASAYGKAFGAAGQGQFGAAGADAAAAMGDMGGYGNQAAGGEEPVSFEKLCEIQGAQTAWAETGQDVNAMLQQVFSISALDWSNMSMWWMTKMASDPNLMAQYGDRSEAYKEKYKGGAPEDPDADISF